MLSYGLSLPKFLLNSMTISYQWLSQYLPVSVPVDELSKILTAIGLEVEAVERSEAVKGGLEGLVTGHVLTCEKHPNADKLNLTTVDIGTGEALKIVCGAPNVAAGQKVIVAPVGATVHPTSGESFQIKKAKIRGEESQGMICAEDEIGLGESHAGIMILPEDTAVGLLARDYFKIPATDYAIHIGLTPNRSDANSHWGVARDVCAYLTHHKGEKVVALKPQPTFAEGTVEKIRVTTHIPDACPRYAGVSISGITVKESPEWLKLKLQTIGVRSINNVVDVTNYVLHEIGQPLHAFDAEKLNGQQVDIRYADKDTSFVGLDGKTFKLTGEEIMICDAHGYVAMGGVFGGNNSGITTVTTEVFLESAYFDPMHIRKASMHHGLRTDAATHFEKGVDVNNVIVALQRAASLIVEVAGGVISSATTDVYVRAIEPKKVKVAYNYIYTLAGKEYGKETVKNILAALQFGIESETETDLVLLVPTDKADVSQPADIVEEIIRIDGLDNVKLTGRLSIALTKGNVFDREAKEEIAQLLCGMGMQEILTNSIVNSKYYPGNERLVRMINSLTSELDVMRPSMLESGLEVVQYNCNRKNQDLALFEWGNIYSKSDTEYIQEPRLAIWLTGDMRKAGWNQTAIKADIFFAKGIVTNLLQYSAIKNATVAYSDDNSKTIWKWKNQVLATAYQVGAATLGQFDIKQDVFFVDIDWNVWFKAKQAQKISYKEVAKFPAVQRDLAIVLDSTIPYKQVQDVTEQLKLDGLQSYTLFDVFESDKLGAGKKSLAVNYVFQQADRTLTDTETEQLMKKLVDAYQSKLGAQIRL